MSPTQYTACGANSFFGLVSAKLRKAARASSYCAFDSKVIAASNCGRAVFTAGAAAAGAAASAGGGIGIGVLDGIEPNALGGGARCGAPESDGGAGGGSALKPCWFGGGCSPVAPHGIPPGPDVPNCCCVMVQIL